MLTNNHENDKNVVNDDPPFDGITNTLAYRLGHLEERAKANQQSIEALQRDCVKKSDFDPVRRLVYGFVAFVLLVVGGMFVTVLVKSGTAPTPTTTQSIPAK